MTLDQIADTLLEAIRPYYKGLPSHGEQPEFRRYLSADQTQKLLESLHNIIVIIKLEESS